MEIWGFWGVKFGVFWVRNLGFFGGGFGGGVFGVISGVVGSEFGLFGGVLGVEICGFFGMEIWVFLVKYGVFWV